MVSALWKPFFVRYSRTTFCRSSAFQSWLMPRAEVEEGAELVVLAAVEGFPAAAGCTRCIPPGADAGAGIVWEQQRRHARSQKSKNRKLQVVSRRLYFNQCRH